MSPAMFDMGDQTPPPPVRLSDDAMGRLAEARRWARMLAITGFSFAGLLAIGAVLGLIALLNAPLSAIDNTRLLAFVPLAVAVLSTLSGSALLWGYAQGVQSFFRSGEPALTRAFRNVRHMLSLWTIFAALSALASLVSTLRKLL